MTPENVIRVAAEIRARRGVMPLEWAELWDETDILRMADLTTFNAGQRVRDARARQLHLEAP